MGDESRFSTATATAPTASLRRHWLVTFIDVLLTSAIAVALFVLLETGLPSPTAGQTTLILCAVFSQNVVLAFWLALASAGSRWRTANVVLGLVLALWLWMAMSIVASENTLQGFKHVDPVAINAVAVVLSVLGARPFLRLHREPLTAPQLNTTVDDGQRPLGQYSIFQLLAWTAVIAFVLALFRQTLAAPRRDSQVINFLLLAFYLINLYAVTWAASGRRAIFRRLAIAILLACALAGAFALSLPVRVEPSLAWLLTSVVVTPTVVVIAWRVLTMACEFVERAFDEQGDGME